MVRDSRTLCVHTEQKARAKQLESAGWRGKTTLEILGCRGSEWPHSTFINTAILGDVLCRAAEKSTGATGACADLYFLCKVLSA